MSERDSLLEVQDIIDRARERDLEDLFEIISSSSGSTVSADDEDEDVDEEDFAIIQEQVDELAQQTLYDLARLSPHHALEEAWRLYHSRFFKTSVQDEYSLDPFSETFSVVDQGTFSFSLKPDLVFELPILPPGATISN
ncbi:hypothetical protein TRICI_002767 [Trichomonascus ciferrii]|uniref:Uncharacterized protein n=1 Tax=Trichomonascus ciferrii TaxID=44093 RepID=A0A642V5N0_9ASCO|nr:hypothetical protein TRICI_002767 [Trichomonascus ciferrii]